MIWMNDPRRCTVFHARAVRSGGLVGFVGSAVAGGRVVVMGVSSVLARSFARRACGRYARCGFGGGGGFVKVVVRAYGAYMKTSIFVFAELIRLIWSSAVS